MSTIRALAIVSLTVVGIALSGCASTQGGTGSNVRVDPHHGQEWEHGMTAVSDVIRPFSKIKNPVEYEQKAGALRGYGALIDLLGR